jgi:site-specific DNA recombinase
VVRRIFDEFAAGRGIYAIAERLTADSIPSPSAHDPARNPHRCGIAWSKSAVRAIINPRYTGRQVWNKQRKDEVLLDVHDVALGHTTKMRWNETAKWVYSDEIAQPPIITTDQFAQVQDILAARGRGPAQHKPHKTSRSYAFAGTIFCGICQRRMQGQWINQANYYRCRFPNEYALANKVDHPRNVYLREDAFGTDVHDWLATLFAPGRLQHTIDLITAAQHGAADDITAHAARARIADANQKMTRYRAAIDAGGDPEEIGTWISQAKAQRIQAETDLRNATVSNRLTRRQIGDLIEGITDMAAILIDADPAKAADAYDKLGLRLTYNPEARTVHAIANPQPGNIGNWYVSEGGLEPLANVLGSYGDRWLSV